MSPNDIVSCGLTSCGKNITKSQGSVYCSQCSKWFHAHCADVSNEQLNFIQKSKGKFVYKCDICPVSDTTCCNVSELREEVRNSNASIQKKLDALLANIGNYDTQIKALNEDVTICTQMIERNDAKTCTVIKQLEDKNEVLQKRFNRPDIIINGLPRKDIKLTEVVLKIFEFLGVNITIHDLNICCYINNRKCVLIKFNSLVKRDAVMRNYFKKGKIRLDDILNNNSSNNNNSKNYKERLIYLNDHLTEKGGKLSRLCRDLRKDDVIAKFRILNSDLPRVKIHFKDTSEKIFEYEECFSYFNHVSCPQPVGDNSAVEDHSIRNTSSTVNNASIENEH